MRETAHTAKALLYELAADVTQPLEFQSAKQNLAIEIGQPGIVADLDRLIADAVAIRDHLAALPAPPAPAIPGTALPTNVAITQDDVRPNDWVRPMRVVNEFYVSRGHLHRLCGLHPIGGPTGFAFRSGGRFLISLSQFVLFAKQHPVRRRETKNARSVTI